MKESAAPAPSTPVKKLVSAPSSSAARQSTVVSARSPLFDNTKFLFMYGIVQWHSGQCGQNIRCFPGKEAILGEQPTVLNCTRAGYRIGRSWCTADACAHCLTGVKNASANGCLRVHAPPL